MKKTILFFSLSIILISCNKPSVSIIYKDKSAQVDFALKNLNDVIPTLEIEKNTSIDIKLVDNCCEKGGFIIKTENSKIQITASDDNGLMYGVFELTELLETGIQLHEITEIHQKPYIKKRGIKYNIPLDIRTSAFDDSGDAAQKNIVNMWEFSFWEHLFDNMGKKQI